MAYDGGYMAAAVQEYVLAYGRERPDSQWISSPFDTWHENPFYGGPDQPHPEDDSWRYEELERAEAAQIEDDHEAALAEEEE